MGSFRLMKASAIETEKDYDRIEYPIYGSPKYDGIRIGCHRELGPVTNSLKTIPNGHIRALMADPTLWGADGEIVVGSPTDPTGYSDTQSAFSTVGGEPEFSFYVFDDFSGAITGCRFAIRMEDARSIVERAQARGLGWVRLVDHVRIEDRQGLDEYCQRVGVEGYEGACFRRHSGRYKYGRSTLIEGHLLKYKPFVDAEAVITGYKLLQRNRNESTVDARGLSVRGYSQSGKIEDPDFVGKVYGTVINGEFAGGDIAVGSGLDDATRHDMIVNWGNYLGKTFTFKYQRFGSKDAGRSPIWKGLRHDI